MFAHETANRCDGCGSGLESTARFIVHDQIDIPLTVFDFLIGQSMEFIRQGTDRFRNQAQRSNPDRQLARFGLEQCPFGPQTIADVIALESVMRFLADGIVRDEQLDASVCSGTGCIHQGGERSFAHDTFEHHTSCDTNMDGSRFQRIVILAVVLRMQIGSLVAGTKIIGIGNPFLAQGGQFCTAFGHDGIFIGGGSRFIFLGLRSHDAKWIRNERNNLVTLYALLERFGDEIVEIAIQDSFGVTRFVIGTQVLDA